MPTRRETCARMQRGYRPLSVSLPTNVFSFYRHQRAMIVPEAFKWRCTGIGTATTSRRNYRHRISS